MKKNYRNYLTIIILFFSIIFLNFHSSASENKKILSLKNNKVNLRQGPSFEYPIKFIYKKKYLPVEILDKSETWKKIRDLNSNTGWIHTSQLKKSSSVILTENQFIFTKPTKYSEPIAVAEKGKLILLKKCK